MKKSRHVGRGMYWQGSFRDHAATKHAVCVLLSSRRQSQGKSLLSNYTQSYNNLAGVQGGNGSLF